MPGKTQLGLYAEVEALLMRETLWFLRNDDFEGGLVALVGRYARGVADTARNSAEPAAAGRSLTPIAATRRGRSRPAACRRTWPGASPSCAAVARHRHRAGRRAQRRQRRSTPPRRSSACSSIFGLGRIIDAGAATSSSPTASTAWRSTGPRQPDARPARPHRRCPRRGSGEIDTRLAAWRAARPTPSTASSGGGGTDRGRADGVAAVGGGGAVGGSGQGQLKSTPRAYVYDLPIIHMG